MVAFPRQGLMRSLPAWGAALLGLLVATVVMALPPAWLERTVTASGVAALLPAIEPPLATAARWALAIGLGALAAALGWAMLYLLFGPGGWLAAPRRRADGVPIVRRADAHPDAPPRRPFSAAGLPDAPSAPAAPSASAAPSTASAPAVTPPSEPDPAVERAIPADLDQPLAAFDPTAIPAVPREPLRPVASLAPGERIETFELTPMVRQPATPAPAAPPSIETLLRRLEQGAVRRAAGAR